LIFLLHIFISLMITLRLFSIRHFSQRFSPHFDYAIDFHFAPIAPILPIFSQPPLFNIEWSSRSLRLQPFPAISSSLSATNVTSYAITPIY